MECKACVQRIHTPDHLIGIYPEWNVKYNKTPVNKKPLQLEYIQNGM